MTTIQIPDTSVLEILAMTAIKDTGIASGLENPYPNPDTGAIDKMFDSYLLPGAMFHGLLEKLHWTKRVHIPINQMLFSPDLQMWGLQRFIGLLCMLKLGHPKMKVPSLKNDEHLIDDIKFLQDKNWPKRSIIIWNFGDPWLNAVLLFDYLKSYHKASVISTDYFKKTYLRTSTHALNNLPIGYHLIELPEEDWNYGIGTKYKGMPVIEVESQLSDGWQLMSWEMLQILAIMPFYAISMNTVNAPNVMLSGFRGRIHNSGVYNLIPSLRFDKDEAELQFGYQNPNNIIPTYGHGVVRYLGPLRKFL